MGAEGGEGGGKGWLGGGEVAGGDGLDGVEGLDQGFELVWRSVRWLDLTEGCGITGNRGTTATYHRRLPFPWAPFSPLLPLCLSCPRRRCWTLV